MMAGEQLGNVLGSLYGYLSEEGKHLLIEVFQDDDEVSNKDDEA
jgi:hypothetical protein